MHWCCSILLITALQDPLTPGEGSLSILPIFCSSQNLLSSLILHMNIKIILNSEKKNSTAIWIGNNCFSSFNGMGSIIALREPLLVQLSCYFCFNNVLYFSLWVLWGLILCITSHPYLIRWHLNGTLDLESMLEWLKTSRDIEITVF